MDYKLELEKLVCRSNGVAHFCDKYSFDDLFTNTLGGFLGAILYRIIYRQEREGIFKSIAILCIAILAPLTVCAAIRTGMDMDFYLSLANRTYG